MNERNLVICDSEINYAYGLGDYISGRNELAVKVFICTNLNQVKKIQEKRQIHMLVLGGETWKTDRKRLCAEQIFIVSTEMEVSLEENETILYRFQSADKILAEIFETYSDKTNQNILKQVKKKKQKIFAIYSPIHRIGKTSFAIAMGKELAKNTKTLYVNLETYADIGGRFSHVAGKDLGDLLYYMKQERGNAALRLSLMVAQLDALDYISPISMCTDLQDIKKEEWESFLIQVLQNSVYENVILDLGNSVHGLFGILQMCDKIYMPVLEDAVSIRKIEQFDMNLQKMRLESVKQNIYRFTAVDNMEEYARKLTKEEG